MAATEDDKPQTTFAAEREKEEKEFLTEVSDIPVTKLPLPETKQVEPLHDDIEGSCELKSGELNTEPDSSNQNKDEYGGVVQEESNLYSIEATSAHSAEVKDVGEAVHFEDGSTENKFNTTTMSSEGDPHATSITAKEAKSSEISSTPEATELDPEILHSSVGMMDEILEKEDSSDVSQSTSTQTACQNDHIEETKGSAQIAKIQPASHMITLNMTDASVGTAGSVNKNYEVKSPDDATDDSNEDVGISSHSECPNKEVDRNQKENGDSNKEQLSSPLFAESTEETISKNMDSDKDEQLEGNSGTKNEDNQGTSKLSLDMKEIKDNELDILGTDRLESFISETQDSSCDKPESIREVSDVASISKESQPKDREVSGIVLMSEKENQPKEIHEDDSVQLMQQKEEVPSEEHNFTLQGSHDMENRSEDDLQVKNIISMCPKEEANYMNDQEIRGNTSEDVATDLEESQSNRRIPESAEENSSLQEFQMIAKADRVGDEANNPELLPIKDLTTVTSDEVPEAVITEAAKDVIWEQKEDPITKESEEIKKRNDKLEDATNLLSQSSEENSNNYQAIEEADDCTDNTNISRMPEEERRLEEVHVDDKSLAASDIDSQEKPLENNNRSNTGLSSEEVSDVKLGNVLDLALQPQTTESEHANKDSIGTGSSNLTENEAAGKASTDKLYRSQDQGVEKIVESEDTHTVKCDAENKKKDDSCKGTAVPESESSDTVIESNVGSDQTCSAAKVVNILEVIPPVMLPKGEDHETWNMVENKKDGSTNRNEDIVNETSDASFATTFNEEFFQKEENEAPESHFRDSPFKDITEEHNGIEPSEAEGKEHVPEVDDPAIVKCENRMELPVEKKTEDEKSLNSDDTSKDDEQLDISRSLGIGTQPNKDDQQEEATELLTRPDEVAQSKVDIEKFQEFIKANNTEINEEKLEGATIEKGETILIEKSNEIQEILSNDHSVEKIGNKHRGTEDSSCYSPREEINQKSDQEDDLKLEVDPEVKADGTFVATDNTSSSTKFEEPEITDAAESFKKEMATEEKFVEGPSQVSAEDETAKYTAEEGTEKRNANDTTTYDEFKQEVDPEVKADETTNNASQSTKTEEHETIYSTQSIQKQISDEEQAVEGPHQTAEEIPNDQPPEEKKERNFIDIIKKDELKPEPHTGLSVDEISETINDASNSTKFEEAETLEATQSFNNHLLSNDKVGEGSWQIEEQLENYIPAEEGKEERNAKDRRTADELKPEIHAGEKFEEPEAVEATQRLNTPMPSGDQVVEVPIQASITEDVVNYSTVEDRKEKRNAIDTTEDDLKPEVDPEVKVDEISATTSNTSQSTKFEGTEIFDATQSFWKQHPTENKGVEVPNQVSTAEEIVNYCPAEEGKEERNVKDTAILQELNPELAPAIKPDEISQTINNASFQEPEPNDASQSVNKQIPSEDKVVEQPEQVSTGEEIVKHHFAKEEETNVKNITIADEVQPKVDPRGRAGEISDTTHFAIESTKFEDPKTVDATQSFNQQTTREDKVVEGPPQVSTADEAVNYGSVEEEREQGNIEDAMLSYELNPDADRGEKINKVSESTENASESTKFEEPHCIDVSENFKKDIPSEEKVVKGHPRVSTEEGNTESNVKETTTRDELKLEVDHKVELEVSEIVEETYGITTHMPSEDKVVEGTPEDSITEDIGNCSPAEERKEHMNVNNAAEDELPTRTKLEETNGTDVTQSFEKEISQKGNVVEEPCQVSAPEEPVNDNSTEEGEERNIIDAATQDELKPEVAPGIKLDEISENMKNASESAKFYEPEPIDATKSVNQQTKSEDKLVEGSYHELTADEIVNYCLEGEGQVKCVKDTIPPEEYHEPNLETESGMVTDEISETHYASESTKLKEPEAVDATTSFQEEKPKEGKIVEGHPKVSTAEEIVNYSPAEEEKDERIVEDTKISNELNPEVDPGEISPIIDNASQITKFEGPEITGVTPSSNKEMPSEEKAVEVPSQVSTPEGTVSYIPEEEQEGKAERNVKETSTRDELKMEADPKIEEDEISETKNSSTETTEFELPEIIEATTEVNIQMPCEDKNAEGSTHVSISQHVESCSPGEERKDKNVNNVTGYESPTRIKLEGHHMPDATQSFEKEIQKQPFLVSAAKELVNDSPSEEGKEEQNVIDAATQDKLQPEVAPGIKLDEISMTMKNFQEPQPIEGPHHVSTEEETVSYHLSDEGEKKNVKDTITMDELKLKAQSRVRTDEISKTDYASESTQFKEAETVDATSSFQKQMSKEGKVVKGPPIVSIAEEIVNCSPSATEEEEERNAKDTTISDDLNPEVDPGAKLNELSETIDNASGSTKIKEPERIEVTQIFSNKVPMEDKVVEGPPQVSTAEEIVNYCRAEDTKTEMNVNETATREPNTEVNPEVEVDEVSKTIKSISEIIKFEVPGTIEATQEINIQMPSEEKVIEEPFKVSIAEDVGNYGQEEESKEDKNVQNTTASETAKLEVPEIVEGTHGINTLMPSEDKVVEGTPEDSITKDIGNCSPAEERKEHRNVNNAAEDDLPTRTKLEETNGTDVTQSFEKEISQKGNVVEEPCQVSATEDPVNDNSTEEGEERNIIDAATQDELKPEVAPGIKLDEISENMKNASESAKFYEPEPIDATKSVNKQIKSEDKLVEGSHHELTADEIVNYCLEGEGQVKCVKDTIPPEEYHEPNSETESGMMTDEISETHYASESTKLKEPEAVDATPSFQEEKPKEGRIVEGQPKVSTAEEIVNYSPAEEEKDERIVKDTTISNELNPEVDPGEISPIIDNASQITKFEGPKITGVTPSSNKEMPREDKAVEVPSQVSTPEGTVSYIPEEEQQGKAERNVKETSTRDEMKMEADPKIEEDEISKSKNSSTETTEFELPEIIEATTEVNIQMPCEDKTAEGSTHVSISQHVESCTLEEERKDKNVNDVTGYESPTRIKLEGYHMPDVTQSFEKEIPKQPFLVSAAEELVNDSPSEAGKEEQNVIDAATQDKLQPEVAPGIKLDEISMTMKNFQEPQPTEGPHHVSTEEEIVSYHLSDEVEEKNVKDTITMDELKLKAQSRVRTDEISKTDYASESTQFKEAETVDATSGFQKQMSKEGKVVKGPSIVSIAEEIVNCSPSATEEEEERNSKDTTISDDLNPEVDPGAKLNELSETIDNASGSTKIKEPERIEVTQIFSNEVPMEDKVVEGPPQVSTAEEIVNYCRAEDTKTEMNVNETATREPNTEVNPEVEVDEVSKTIKSTSETIKFEVPGTIEATQEINIQMPSEEKVIEEPFKVSIAEDVGNYGQEEESKEDKNVQNTTASETAKLEEPEIVEGTHGINTHMPSEDKVVEGTPEDSITEDIGNCSPAEERKEHMKRERKKLSSLEGPEITGVTPSSNKEMPSEDKAVELPSQVSTPEGTGSYIPEEEQEGKAERYVKEMSARDELEMEADLKIEEDEISETKHNSTETTEMPSEDKIAEASMHVSIAKHVGSCSLEEERKDKNGNGATGYESPTRTKIEGSHMTDATQSFGKEIPKQPFLVSAAEEIVNDSPAEEGKGERNATSQDELQPEVAPGIKLDEISMTMKNFREPEPIDATQSVKEQITSEDKVVEGPRHVAIEEEIISYHLADEGDEKNVGDTITMGELKLKAQSGVRTDEISETHYFKEAKTVDATSSLQNQMSKEDKVAQWPPIVSTAEQIVNCSPAEEEEEERNAKDTISDDLKPEVDPEAELNELSETIDNASESTKIKEPERIDVTQSFNNEETEDKVAELPPQFSTAEEIVNYSCAEEGKAEENVKETATREPNTEVNPKVEGDEVSKTTKSTSETSKFEIPETIEASQGINIQMPSEEKAIEEPFKVSIAEDVGNYRREEERKEDINVQNTTADKLPTQIKANVISNTNKSASQSTKLEETDEADVTQCFKKQIASKDQVVEGPCQVPTAEELVNFSPAEEEKEESSVMDMSIQDEVKPEVAPEITPDETLGTLKNASESTEIQEPETTDANQSSNKQMTYEDRDIEGPRQVSIAEGIDYYSLVQGEEWNVNDTRSLYESEPDVNPEARADPISETTYYASRSTKFEEPDTVDARQNFNKQMPGEKKVVEGPPQVSTAEEMVDYSPAEERKEEQNIKDTTTSDDLKPEVDPGLKPNNTSNLINNASQNTKKCNKQMPSEYEVIEGHPQIPTAEGLQNYRPAEEGTEESSGKDTSAKDDLKTEVYPVVKFEESETIDATKSSKKKISSEDNVVGESCEISTAKEITHYSIEEEGEETNVKDTTTADELKTEENTREKFDETETTDATQSFEKQMPSDVESFGQCSTAVEMVNYSPAEDEPEERNVQDATTKLELQEQAAKLPSRNTETEVTTSDEKIEIPEVGFPKYDEGATGCNDRHHTYRNDLGENIVSEAETLKPVDEKIEDYPKGEDAAEEDTNALESHKDDGQIQYSPSKSLYEITNDPGGLNLEKQGGSVDKAVNLLHSGISGDEENNKLDKEEQYFLITEKESREDVSSTAQGRKFKDEEKEEKVEEQENHSTRTSVTKLDRDEIFSKKIENEDKIFHNQNQNSDLPITGQESAREIQVEIKELHPGKDSIVVASEVGGESRGERKTIDECEGTSSSIQSDLIPEVNVGERPIEEILARAECREDKDRVDTSIKEIAQKDELAALTQATNNSQDIDMPCKSSIAMSDLEILANEDPETGSESQILSEKKEISQVHEGLRGETLQPETEELKPGDTSQAVAEAVRAEYGEKEQFNDDSNKQTENFRSDKLEENSPSKLEQSSQETPQEQEDGEAQDQQNNINDSRVEIARNERPLDASSQMDTNLPLDMQKLDVAPCEFDKQVEEADPKDSSVDTKVLPEVQQKTIAESFCAGGENQDPVKCNEDKETEEAIGKSIFEKKSTTSLPELLKVPRNEISQDSGDFNSESKKTIQREEMKDGKTRTCEPEEQNTDEDKDEEGEGNQQQRTKSGYDHPVAVEASKDINVKASPKKSHNIFSGVGSKVKHSISKVKKVITGKSSHPKQSSPK